jgi:hypothetical protein
MAITRQLYELQEFDIDIEHTEQTLALKNSQLGNRDTLNQAQSVLDAGKKSLDELKKIHHDTENQVDDLSAKIKGAEQQLYGGTIKNPKELSNLQHEIATLKSVRDPLETKELELMDQVEEAAKKAAALTADYTRLEETWGKEQTQIAADIELLKKTLAGLKETRRERAEQIEPSAVKLYEDVRRPKKQAVAKLEQGICRACRISQSANILQKARSGQPVLCNTCGRILFSS